LNLIKAQLILASVGEKRKWDRWDEKFRAEVLFGLFMNKVFALLEL
jgi:hypothetical protein